MNLILRETSGYGLRATYPYDRMKKLMGLQEADDVSFALDNPSPTPCKTSPLTRAMYRLKKANLLPFSRLNKASGGNCTRTDQDGLCSRAHNS